MFEVISFLSESDANYLAFERAPEIAQKRWLGLEEPPERKAEADRIRSGYFTTATEYYRAAQRQYESLTLPEPSVASPSSVFPAISRNVQLFVAYSTLWEAFRYLYNAAAHTDFARNGQGRQPLETEREKIARVLREPILPALEVAKITLLRNGESPTGAIQRICSRHSRELEKIAGETYEQTVTDMDAFLQGVSVVPKGLTAEDTEHITRSGVLWGVRALDDAGQPIDADSPLDAAKYRSVITWLCYQIRLNINFVGKSDDSLDDVILIMRSFCLLEPLVGLLLRDSRKDAVFAL